MPKINELTTRPGGPQPTDEMWLASAGGAADFKSTFSAILTFVADNMATALPVQSYTPALASSGVNATYTVQHGRYVRFGNLVWVSARIDWSALSGDSGSIQATLPALAGGNQFAELLSFSGFGFTLPSGVTFMNARVRQDEARVDFVGSGSDGTHAALMSVTSLASSGRITYSGVYVAG